MIFLQSMLSNNINVGYFFRKYKFVSYTTAKQIYFYAYKEGYDSQDFSLEYFFLFILFMKYSKLTCFICSDNIQKKTHC